MKAIITAGGKGTRLSPITNTQNKHLICVGNKPLILYAIESVADAGIKEIGVVRSADNAAVEQFLGDGKKWGINITYILQEKPLGLGHVVQISEKFINKDPFVLYLGDNLLVGGIKTFVAEFQKHKPNCHLVLSKERHPSRFGVAEVIGNKIISIEEKPKNPKSHYAVVGIYIYDDLIFEAVKNIQKSDRGEYEISDAHQYLISKNANISFSKITNWWKDTGTSEDMLEANRLILEHQKAEIENSVKIDSETKISGNVRIGAKSEIINSKIRGPVVIGENCRIFSSFIGPFTSIYHNVEIEDSEVEYSIIHEDCKLIKVKRRIENSLLGKGVTITTVSEKPKSNKFLLGENSSVEIV